MTAMNAHAENINEAGKRQNIASSIGYLVAALTAIISACLSSFSLTESDAWTLVIQIIG